MANVVTITHGPDGIRISMEGSILRYATPVELAEAYAYTMANHIEVERELDKARQQLREISQVLTDEKIDEYRALKGRIDAILSDIPF
jgi:hypothetical protein